MNKLSEKVIIPLKVIGLLRISFMKIKKLS